MASSNNNNNNNNNNNITEFHKAIAEQIALLAGMPEDQAILCIEEPRNLAKADLALVVAKLNKFKKLPGNPAQVAADWKSKVFPPPLRNLV